MKSEHSWPQVEAGGFRTTRWSVVLLSAQSQAPGSKAALAELCSAYWYPLECAAQGKTATFEVLKAFLDPINSATPPSYEQIAAQLKVSIGAVKTLIHRLRKQHSAFVRQEISRTVSDSADVDAEVHELCEAIIAAEGWVVP